MELNAIMEYIKPELLVLIPVLYFVGIGLKSMSVPKDKYIPAVLAAVGVVLAAVWVLATSDIAGVKDGAMAVFTALVQGILCAGASVYVNQLIKQSGKDE